MESPLEQAVSFFMIVLGGEVPAQVIHAHHLNSFFSVSDGYQVVVTLQCVEAQPADELTSSWVECVT